MQLQLQLWFVFSSCRTMWTTTLWNERTQYNLRLLLQRYNPKIKKKRLRFVLYLLTKYYFFYNFSSYKIFNRWHFNKTLFCFKKPQYQTFFCRRCGLSLLNSMRKGRQSRMAQLVDHRPVDPVTSVQTLVGIWLYLWRIIFGKQCNNFIRYF